MKTYDRHNITALSQFSTWNSWIALALWVTCTYVKASKCLTTHSPFKLQLHSKSMHPKHVRSAHLSPTDCM